MDTVDSQILDGDPPQRLINPPIFHIIPLGEKDTTLGAAHHVPSLNHMINLIFTCATRIDPFANVVA
jgi:hypothetical protein